MDRSASHGENVKPHTCMKNRIPGFDECPDDPTDQWGYTDDWNEQVYYYPKAVNN